MAKTSAASASSAAPLLAQLAANDREERTLPRIERRGRPTKLTPELLERIAGHVREGALPKVATLACGISESSYLRWCDAAEDPKSDAIFHEFRLVLDGTHALCKMAVAKRMYRDAMEGAPSNWAKHVGMEGHGANRVELSGPNGTAIPVEHSHEGLVAGLLDEFAAMNERSAAKAKAKK